MKIFEDKEKLLRKLGERGNSDNEKYIRVVKEMINDVKIRKDDALIEYTNKFDSPIINKSNIKVSDEEILNAYKFLDDELKETYRVAKERIFKFHEHQKEKCTVWQIPIVRYAQ